MNPIIVASLVVAGACASNPSRASTATPVALAAADVADVVDVVLEGALEILIEDSAPQSRILYFLVSGARRTPLRFSKPPSTFTTGDRVRVRGRWDSGTLVVTKIERMQVSGKPGKNARGLVKSPRDGRL